MDKLDKIYNKQFKLQEKLGVIKKIKDPIKKQSYINQIILACYEELNEIIRETHYKNPHYVEFGWKKNSKFDNEKFKDEIIDLIHFVINLCIVADMDPNEILNRYFKKNNINKNRIEENY